MGIEENLEGSEWRADVMKIEVCKKFSIKKINEKNLNKQLKKKR